MPLPRRDVIKDPYVDRPMGLADLSIISRTSHTKKRLTRDPSWLVKRMQLYGFQGREASQATKVQNREGKGG